MVVIMMFAIAAICICVMSVHVSNVQKEIREQKAITDRWHGTNYRLLMDVKDMLDAVRKEQKNQKNDHTASYKKILEIDTNVKTIRSTNNY